MTPDSLCRFYQDTVKGDYMQKQVFYIVLFLSVFCAKNPFFPEPVPDEPLMDIDGNVYQTVRIGNQVWMAENLRTTRYNDGTPVSLDTSKTTWTYTKTEKYCYYGNITNADSIRKFGALYNWFAVNTKKLAPSGWHIPTYAEWDTLQNYMISKGYNYDGVTTGNKIGKSLAAKTDWVTSTNTGAVGNNQEQNNSSGFSAFPGGMRYSDGGFDGIGCRGSFWTATECTPADSRYRYLNFSNGYLLKSYFHKSCGFSVRCVRD